MIMEVLVGSTFSMEVSSPPPLVPPPSSTSQQDEQHHSVVATRIFEDGSLVTGRIRSGKLVEEQEVEDSSSSPDEDEGEVTSSGSSSSIGVPDDSDDDEEEVNSSVDSSKLGLGLGSLDSLEESLPIKRGLSNHFSGKSKSFANLSDVGSSVNSVKEVEKPENPFNKRRRILMANKFRKSSFYSWSNPKSMPLLALKEEAEAEAAADAEEDEEENDPEEVRDKMTEEKKKGIRGGGRALMDRKFKASFKSYSCFSLTDLQEEHEHHLYANNLD